MYIRTLFFIDKFKESNNVCFASFHTFECLFYICLFINWKKDKIVFLDGLALKDRLLLYNFILLRQYLANYILYLQMALVKMETFYVDVKKELNYLLRIMIT